MCLTIRIYIYDKRLKGRSIIYIIIIMTTPQEALAILTRQKQRQKQYIKQYMDSEKGKERNRAANRKYYRKKQLEKKINRLTKANNARKIQRFYRAILKARQDHTFSAIKTIMSLECTNQMKFELIKLIRKSK